MTTGTRLTLRISVPRFWLALLCFCGLFPILFCFCCMLCNCCHQVLMKWLIWICWFFFCFFLFYLWLFLVMESSLKCEVCCTPHHGSEFWKILQQNKNIMLWMWIFTLACAVINSLCKGRFLLQWLNFKCNEQPYRFIRTYKAELCNSSLSKYYICTYTILWCMCFYTLTSTWWQCSCRYTDVWGIQSMKV